MWCVVDFEVSAGSWFAMLVLGNHAEDCSDGPVSASRSAGCYPRCDEPPANTEVKRRFEQALIDDLHLVRYGVPGPIVRSEILGHFPARNSGLVADSCIIWSHIYYFKPWIVGLRRRPLERLQTLVKLESRRSGSRSAEV